MKASQRQNWTLVPSVGAKGFILGAECLTPAVILNPLPDPSLAPGELDLPHGRWGGSGGARHPVFSRGIDTSPQIAIVFSLTGTLFWEVTHAGI